MLNKKEEMFLNMALEAKEEYEKCSWWKFRKRYTLYNKWQNALDLMIKYS